MLKQTTKYRGSLLYYAGSLYSETLRKNHISPIVDAIAVALFSDRKRILAPFLKDIIIGDPLDKDTHDWLMKNVPLIFDRYKFIAEQHYPGKLYNIYAYIIAEIALISIINELPENRDQIEQLGISYMSRQLVFRNNKWVNTSEQ